MEIESNLRNEITNSYGDFEIASNKAFVSLHKDRKNYKGQALFKNT
jgi:hypothetical protein